MIKLSVIVPVFNTEKYLVQCLDSLINQTYKNIEIICIDDASSDDSCQILEMYASKDSRIKVFKNLNNIGAGLTRNKGVEVASGDYIHFMDSDDWLDVDAYEKLVTKINSAQEDIDILLFKLKKVLDNSKKHTELDRMIPDEFCEKVISLSEELRLRFEWDTINATKIYNRKFLLDNQLMYRDSVVCEDVYFCYLTFLKAKTVYMTNNQVYNYRILDSSLNSNRYQMVEDLKRIFYDVVQITGDCSQPLREHICKPVFYFCYWSLWKSYRLKNITYQQFKDILAEYDNDILKHEFSHCWWYCYATELFEKPKCYIIVKNFIRQFLSCYCKRFNKYIIKSHS